MIKKTLDLLLRPFDLEVNARGTGSVFAGMRRAYRERANDAARVAPNSVSCIIFSKDRPLQLHALLQSYFEQTTNIIPIAILYDASNQEFIAAYDILMKIFSKRKVEFIKQKSADSFKDDLITILDRTKTEKIIFLVDDIVFVEPFDLEYFSSFDTNIFVPSLRLGKNISYFYHFGCPQPHPPYLAEGTADSPMLFWRWSDGVYDWGYPLSLDGNLFATRELFSLIKESAFKAPNSLEDALQQFIFLFDNRKGVCFGKAVIVNIPCNRVQKENKNLSGNISEQFLLTKWLDGYQMDYRGLFGFKNISPQQEIEFKLIKRDTAE